MSETRAARSPSPTADWPGVGRGFAWLKERERTILLVGIALQVLVLLGLIIYHAMPLARGETILLRVMPAYPHNLLHGDYGDYMRLSYDFSRVPPEGVEGLLPDPYKGTRTHWRGRTVYVSLVPEPDGEHYRADRFSIHRPTDGKYLRGTITGSNRLEFGIESYYVQKGGRKYENAIRTRKLSAEVAVDSNGRAKLRALRVE